jgi:hypothetical protein
MHCAAQRKLNLLFSQHVGRFANSEQRQQDSKLQVSSMHERPPKALHDSSDYLLRNRGMTVTLFNFLTRNRWPMCGGAVSG